MTKPTITAAAVSVAAPVAPPTFNFNQAQLGTNGNCVNCGLPIYEKNTPLARGYMNQLVHISTDRPICEISN